MLGSRLSGDLSVENIWEIRTELVMRRLRFSVDSSHFLAPFAAGYSSEDELKGEAGCCGAIPNTSMTEINDRFSMLESSHSPSFIPPSLAI